MTDQQKVIARIQKLLKMAEDSAAGGENEREIALTRAHKLMVLHNIALNDVVDIDSKEDRDEIQVEEFPEAYRITIATAIAKLFMCKMFRTQIPNKQKYMLHFVGLESNITTAAQLTRYVINSIAKEATKRQKELGQNTGWGTSFRNSAALAIQERCKKLREESEADTDAYLKDAPQLDNEPAYNGSTALVVANMYQSEEEANDKYIEAILNVKLKTRKSVLVSKSRDASAQGREYGNQINLNQQLAGKTAPKLGN